MLRIGVLGAVVAVVLASHARGAVVGYVEHFAAEDGVAGFFPPQLVSNPGTGGIGGDGDGYLHVRRVDLGNFGASTDRTEFTGNLLADGVTGFGFWINDVGSFDDFQLHVGIGTRFEDFWLYREAFRPLSERWTYVEVDLLDPSKWIQTQGSNGVFEEALQNSGRLLIRHDLEPLRWDPDPKQGDLGVDGVVVLPEPGTGSLLLSVGVAAVARRRRASWQ